MKYACNLSGVTQLMMMKADVLSGFDEIKVCTHYMYMGEKIDYLPYNIEEQYLTPVYTTLPGWSEDLTSTTSADALPENLKSYIAYIEEQLGIPVTIVSVGPDRTQTITRG
jgi:adenylosuccinate synthase